MIYAVSLVVLGVILLLADGSDSSDASSSNGDALALLQASASGRSKTRRLFKSEAQSGRLIRFPEVRLEFCMLDKVAHREFDELFRQLGWATPSTPYNDCGKRDGWKYAYFTRDPLERYVGSFLCVGFRRDLKERYGPMFTEGMLDNITEERIKLFHQRVLHDAEHGLDENSTLYQHFLPQYLNLRANKYCNWCFPLDQVDFVGHLNSDHMDVNRQVKQMLHMVSAENATLISDQFFPPTSIAGQHNAEFKMEDFYRDPKILDAALRLYRQDYVELRLPVPAFARSAFAAIQGR